MYWLIGIVVIITMIATLAVADGIVLPASPLFESMTGHSMWPALLLIALLLWLLMQRNALSSNSSNGTAAKIYPPTYTSPNAIARYLVATVLASLLIVGSALHALSSHQQAESLQVKAAMRVQALVTIEEISDSVYDMSTNSGYRQVAVIKDIMPLVSELTAKELDKLALEYIAPNTSLSKHNVENKAIVKDSSSPSQYRVLLSAYPNKNGGQTLAAVNQLQPGDQLLMTMTLAPLAQSESAINNPSGFDSYRWLRGRHIDGVATIIALSQPINSAAYSKPIAEGYVKRLRMQIDQWRWQLRQHFYQDWAQQTNAQQQADAVTLSLLTGDRSLINRETKDLYQLAGISHLLAISGTHVLFLAIILAGAVTALFDRRWPTIYSHLPRWQVRWWVMIGAAFIYALFTGFDVPAARTAWMLLAIGLVRLTLLPISTTRVLLALATLMAWADPYVLWQAGYWLSFIAVALLLKYDDSLSTQNPLSSTQQAASLDHAFVPRFWLLCKRIVKLQAWLFIALLPITLLLFGKASLWGLIVNIFAIGLFGWVIVPLNLLAGLCYLLLPSIVADSLWTMVSAIVGLLHELITGLTALPSLKGAWLYTPVTIGTLLIAFIVLLPWLLPRGLVSRWLALPPLTLLMVSVSASQLSVSRTPTLYILPTTDRYLTAAVLLYPMTDKVTHQATDSVSWLFLADHRPQDTRTNPSAPNKLNADKLSASLEQQLRTLSIKQLEGIVVQTSSADLTDSLPSMPLNASKKESANPWYKNSKKNNATANTSVSGATTSASALLPMTIAKLSQNIPTKQYWQAGRSERWATLKQSYASSQSPTANAVISAQRCVQGKMWQSANNELAVQAITGWSEIADSKVWDCAIAIDSNVPIRVLQYNAAHPLQSSELPTQILSQTAIASARQAVPAENEQNTTSATVEADYSRLVIDVATDARLWQLWSLLCSAQPMTTPATLNLVTMWLSHSSSQVAPAVLKAQSVSEVMTYDMQPLDAALAIKNDP